MKERASVTIYFSLILIVLLAVMLTTVESARLAGVRVRCQSAGALGLESLFADYAAPLFEEYGLLFLEGSYGTGEREAYLNRYREYVSYNADCNYSVYLGNDFYSAKLTEAVTESIIYATDKEGKALEQQVCAAVVEHIPVNFLENILEKLELSNQCGLLTKFFDGINRISDKVDKVDKAVQKIYEGVEELKKFQKNLEEKIEDLGDLVERLDSAWESYEDADTEEEEDDAWDDVKYYEKRIANLKKEIVKQQEKMQKSVKTVLEQEKIYKEKTQEVSEKLIELKQELLEEQEGEVKEEIVKAIEKQTTEIQQLSGGEGDIYQVEAAAVPLQNSKEVLDETLKTVKSSGLSENQLLEVLEQQNEYLQQYGISQLEILFDNHYQEKSENSLFKTIKNLLNQGITEFVMDGKEISSACLEKEELPSAEYGDKAESSNLLKELLCTDNLGKELWEIGKSALLTDEYVMNYFNSAGKSAEDTDKQKHVLCYEAEYVLCGELSDQKNLEKTIQQMVLLRTGMNIIYLLSDTESCSQAQALAIGIVGFTGMAGLIRVTQLLLLAAWAYGEALLDVRSLLKGGKVAFLKTKSDWKTGISELINIGKIGDSVTEDEKGLSYQDYMHILMIKEEQSQKLYRIMDLLQVNLRQNGWEGFRMDQCIYALEIKADFCAQPLFLNISPFAYLKEIDSYVIHTVYASSY